MMSRFWARVLSLENNGKMCTAIDIRLKLAHLATLTQEFLALRRKEKTGPKWFEPVSQTHRHGLMIIARGSSNFNTSGDNGTWFCNYEIRG